MTEIFSHKLHDRLMHSAINGGYVQVDPILAQREMLWFWWILHVFQCISLPSLPLSKKFQFKLCLTCWRYFNIETGWITTVAWMHDSCQYLIICSMKWELIVNNSLRSWLYHVLWPHVSSSQNRYCFGYTLSKILWLLELFLSLFLPWKLQGQLGAPEHL